MAQLTISGVVRELLKASPQLTNDELVQRAKAKGLKVPDAKIRDTIYNVRSDLKKAAAKAKAPAAPAAARTTAPAAKVATAAPAAAAPAQPAAEPANLTSVLANVALVNAAVSGAGGVDAARKVAEAVRSCGSVDAFLLHLDLVAGIRTNAD